MALLRFTGQRWVFSFRLTKDGRDLNPGARMVAQLWIPGAASPVASAPGRRAHPDDDALSVTFCPLVTARLRGRLILRVILAGREFSCIEVEASHPIAARACA
jgi:hypothetical protein